MTNDVLIRKEGLAGRITLNRPDALNALSYEMVTEIEKALIAWRDDTSIRCVIIDGAGEKAFCAGGDIDEMYQAGIKGDYSFAEKFFTEEYRLNAMIARYPKPYLALIHGFVMGGGVGVSGHGSHRVVMSSAKIAMPECGIGLVPDVGSTHLLANARGYLGEYLGMTGYRMNAADAILAGFADAHIPDGAKGDLIEAICDTGDLSFVETFETEPEADTLSPLLEAIDLVFSRRDTAEIIEKLETMNDEWAVAALKSLNRNDPLSLECTLQLIRRARISNTIEDALAGEFGFTSRASEHGNFLEGTRAAIVDKDRKPKWKYGTLNDVPDQVIEKMLASA
ncbi:MAG: enoyl-CoA hydratase/isomerase family protein [Hyphomicrobiales bacterium]